jgi:lysophospholipase L1-like esterase
MRRSGDPSLSRTNDTPGAPAERPRGGCLTGLALLVVSTVATLLVLEVGVRILAPQPLLDSDMFLQETGSAGLPVNDARATARSVARSLRPNTDVMHQTSEFDVRVRINSHGLRDDEIPYAKPAGTKRILFLGDSMTFGYGVEAEQAFPDLVRAALGSLGVQTINAGCPSFGTCDELDFFREEGVKYHPDIVAVVFFRNDVEDNVDRSTYRMVGGRLEHVAREIAGSEAKTDAIRVSGDPFDRDILNVGAAHETAPLAASRPIEPSFVIRHSQLARLIRLRWALLTHKIPDPQRAMARRTEAEVALTAAIMGELMRQIRAAGAKPVLILMPAKEVVVDGTRLPAPTVAFAPVVEAAKAEGARVIDLTDALRAANETRDPYFAKDAHPNAWGHEAAAKAIAPVLRALLQ